MRASTEEDLRPKRQKKRRRYDDASYEGYEGYEEDDAGTATGSGVGSGPGGGGGSWEDREKKKKKRKRVGDDVCERTEQRLRVSAQDVDSPGMDLGRHSVPVQSSMIYGR